jgi:hypothetical protein
VLVVFDCGFALAAGSIAGFSGGFLFDAGLGAGFGKGAASLTLAIGKAASMATAKRVQKPFRPATSVRPLFLDFVPDSISPAHPVSAIRLICRAPHCNHFFH